jgi:hypothetical protein
MSKDKLPDELQIAGDFLIKMRSAVMDSLNEVPKPFVYVLPLSLKECGGEIQRVCESMVESGDAIWETRA